MGGLFGGGGGSGQSSAATNVANDFAQVNAANQANAQAAQAATAQANQQAATQQQQAALKANADAQAGYLAQQQAMLNATVPTTNQQTVAGGFIGAGGAGGTPTFLNSNNTTPGRNTLLGN